MELEAHVNKPVSISILDEWIVDEMREICDELGIESLGEVD